MKPEPQVIDGVTYYPVEVPLPVGFYICGQCSASKTQATGERDQTLCTNLSSGASATNRCWSDLPTRDVRIFWQTKEGYALWRLTK